MTGPTLRCILTTGMSLILCACSGGGCSGDDETEATDDTAPTISWTFPGDGEIDVEPDVIVSAQFSEDIFAVTVSDDDGSVLGSVSFDSETNTASFMPSSGLVLLRQYDASITSDITDLTGNSLLTDHNWKFTVRDGIWETPEKIDDLVDTGIPDHQLAMDDNGNAMAIWLQIDSTQSSVWSSCHTPGIGWGGSDITGKR